MKKQLDAFYQAADSFDSRVTDLQQEIKQKQTDHATANEIYRQAMIDDSAGTKAYTTAELSQLKRTAEDLASEIDTASERIKLLTEGAGAGKTEKLHQLLEEVRAGWQRELDNLNGDITRIFQEARELRAQLTLKISEANEHYKRAYQLRNELNSAEKTAGVSVLEQTKEMGIPNKPPVSEYSPAMLASLHSDKGVLPSEGEINDAFRSGDLPLWIQHYADTGELLTNDEVRNKPDNSVQTAVKGAKGFISRVFGKEN